MDKHAKVDSLGIFVIGPAAGIRMAYSPAVVGGLEPEILYQDRRTEKHYADAKGKFLDKGPHLLHTFNKPAKGSG